MMRKPWPTGGWGAKRKKLKFELDKGIKARKISMQERNSSCQDRPHEEDTFI
jgi:hypothetical protein